MTDTTNKSGKISIGGQAPDFSLSSQSGAAVRLSDFRGKKYVILYFYPRDFTRGCSLEAITFAENYEAFTKLNTEVLGVSGDSVDTHRRFSSEFRLPFPLLSDNRNRVRQTYGVSKTFGLVPGRVTFIIDQHGIVRKMFSSQCSPERHTREAFKSLVSITAEDAERGR